MNFSLSAVLVSLVLLSACSTGGQIRTDATSKLPLTPAADASIPAPSGAVQEQVRAATFEIVVPRDESDAISYERPLPLELLPFQVRNDKYFSIGTAFAIDGNRFVTAGHVLMALRDRNLGPAALRDRNGHVYPIAQVFKFSSAEDFSVFSVEGDPRAPPLKAGKTPSVGDAVYAVGNALGEGVVIREGLYTSDTPEVVAGRWKWLRFSAAASPGNSGGPLINKAGEVIGAVLAKSPNENLNVAVSIEQVVNAPENVGSIDIRSTYQLDIFSRHETSTLKEAIALPLPFKSVIAQLNRMLDAFEDRQLAALLRSNAQSLFPNGEGSRRQLNLIQTDDFPMLVIQRADSVWEARKPTQIEAGSLPDNGYLWYGKGLNQILFHLRRPETLSPRQFYGDASVMMDSMLRAYPMHRTIENEKIRITSLGKPSNTSSFTDAYGRKWQVLDWYVKFQNAHVIVLTLPVPDGSIGLMRFTTDPHAAEIDLRAMADFVSVSYGGTIAQWKAFLKEQQLLPSLFSSLHISVDQPGTFNFDSKRFAFALTSDVLPLMPQTLLYLDTSFFLSDGRPVWDVAEVTLKETLLSKNRIYVWRMQEPPAGLEPPFREKWDKMAHRRHPYDGVIALRDDGTWVSAVKGASASESVSGATLCGVEIGREGTHTEAEMGAALNAVLSKLVVKEH